MKILLAYDGFEHSRHALEETAKLAADGRGEVTVMSVVPEADARPARRAATGSWHPMPIRTLPSPMIS